MNRPIKCLPANLGFLFTQTRRQATEFINFLAESIHTVPISSLNQHSTVLTVTWYFLEDRNCENLDWISFKVTCTVRPLRFLSSTNTSYTASLKFWKCQRKVRPLPKFKVGAILQISFSNPVPVTDNRWSAPIACVQRTDNLTSFLSFVLNFYYHQSSLLFFWLWLCSSPRVEYSVLSASVRFFFCERSQVLQKFVFFHN